MLEENENYAKVHVHFQPVKRYLKSELNLQSKVTLEPFFMLFKIRILSPMASSYLIEIRACYEPLLGALICCKCVMNVSVIAFIFMTSVRWYNFHDVCW